MNSRPGASFPIGATATLDELAADPNPLLAELRAGEPVSWLPAIGGWMITRRDLAVDVLRDADTFTVDDPRFSTARVIGPSMLSLDGFSHLRHRTPFEDPFRSTEVRRRLAGWTVTRAEALIHGFAGDGRAELRSQLAAPLAAEVMTEALSLEGIGTADLLDVYDAIVEAVDEVTAGGTVPERGSEAFAELKRAVVVTMRSRPDSLPAQIRESSDLNDDEIASNIAVLLFGGIVTSEGTAASLLYHLLSDESSWNDLQSDRSLIPGAVEEALRIEPAAAVVDRYATRDVRLAAALIRRSDLVRVSLSAASRDPVTFPDPDRFEMRRANASRHLAFARGPHACLGVHLARLEARVVVDELLSTLPALQMDRGATDSPQGLIFRSPPRVTATWNRAEDQETPPSALRRATYSPNSAARSSGSEGGE